MSSVPSSMPPGSLPPSGPTRSSEIKLISHSTLFYWWPVWALAFFMAFWTYLEGRRLAIVPEHGVVTKTEEGENAVFTIQVKANKNVDADSAEKKLEAAARFSASNPPEGPISAEPFPAKISHHAWLGSVFLIVLILTIIITNVPLRGLWSFLVIMGVILLAVLITLFKAWDDIFEKIGNLQIHINMAGYLFIGVAVFAIWALATWVFDRRAYIIFTPGQIKVCEHIGASVQTYNTVGVSLEKQRDDLFRHYILGFGSGDLILKMTTGDKREIRVPNVLGIGWRLKTVEDMLRSIATT